MNESRTVVATTTRTRPSRDRDVAATEAFRSTPAGLADGLGLGSIRRERFSLRPWCVGPPRPASGAGLLLPQYINVLSCRGGFFGGGGPFSPCWRGFFLGPAAPASGLAFPPPP